MIDMSHSVKVCPYSIKGSSTGEKNIVEQCRMNYNASTTVLNGNFLVQVDLETYCIKPERIESHFICLI
jgi:hypothetical protein